MLKTIFISLAVGNFAYAMVTGHSIDTALERTIFQAVALVCVAFAQWLRTEPKFESGDQTPPAGPRREPKRGDPDWIESIDG